MTGPNKKPKAPPVCPCAACGLDVPDNSKAVGCDCDKWYHLKCTELNDKQYKALSEDAGPMTWVCRDCLQLKLKIKASADNINLKNTTLPGNSEEKTKQLEEIIKLLMSDIDDLKVQLLETVNEKEKLSELVVKKIEVIYKLEQALHNFAVGHRSPASQDIDLHLTETETTESDCNAASIGRPTPSSARTHHKPTAAPEKDRQHLKNDKPGIDLPGSGNTTQPEALIISDSIMRGAASVMKNEKGLNITAQVIPGAKIRDFSRFISNAREVPKKVIINIGSNNLSTAKTPNHVMRPIWLTLYAAQKYFKNTKWYVNSILYRRDLRDKHVKDNNDALKFMCNQLGLTFINTIDEITDDCYGLDGIHPNKKGAHLLADIIAKAAELEGVSTGGTNELNKSHKQDSSGPMPEDQDASISTDLTIENQAGPKNNIDQVHTPLENQHTTKHRPTNKETNITIPI